MVGCTSDDWVLLVFSFHANHNDTTILEDCFNRYEDKTNTIHEDNVILINRSFQDIRLSIGVTGCVQGSKAVEGMKEVEAGIQLSLFKDKSAR